MKLGFTDDTKRLVRRAAFHHPRPNRRRVGVFVGLGVGIPAYGEKEGKVYGVFTGSSVVPIDDYKKQFTDWEVIDFGF